MLEVRNIFHKPLTYSKQNKAFVPTFKAQPEFDVFVKRLHSLGVEQLINDLNSNDAEKQTIAVFLLCSKKDERILPAFIKLFKSSSDPTIKQLIINRFEAIGNSTVSEPLIDLIKTSNDNFLRIRSTEVLKRYVNKNNVEYLIKNLDGADDFAIKTFAEILGDLDDQRATKPLIAALEHDSPKVREVTSRALGNLKAKEAVPYLIERLKDDIHVTCAAAEALGKIKDPKAIPALISLAETTDYDSVHAAAIIALAEIGDKSTIETIIKFKNNAARGVREAVAIALEKFEDPRPDVIGALCVIIVFDDSTKIATRAAKKALVKLAKIGGEPVINELKDYAYKPVLVDNFTNKPLVEENKKLNKVFQDILNEIT